MKNKVRVKADIDKLRRNIINNYANKYYNLFLGSFDCEGLTQDQRNYVLRQLWALGTCACFPIKMKGEAVDLAYCTYATHRFNMYDLPAEVDLINKWNMPFFPEGPQTVDVDVAIGWLNPNHKGIKETVDYYIERLTQVEMVINTNLQVHKMPFLVGVTPQDENKAKDVIDRILNDELVVFEDLEDLNMVKSLVTATPFIIDKLYSYKTSLENELLTILGLDNAMEKQDGKQWASMDEVNANNQLINTYRETMNDCLQEWTDNIAELFGIQISIKSKQQEQITSVHNEEDYSGGNEDGNNE